jgi:hypothetical protein
VYEINHILYQLSEFLWYWGLNTGPTSRATSPALFCDGYFQDRISWTIFPDWLWTEILLISASWVARITGMSHQHLATFWKFDRYSLSASSPLWRTPWL